MKLYHGTNIRFTEINLSLSKRGKDFGCGFYLSADYEQAQQLAQTRCDFLGGEAVVNIYEFDPQVLDNAGLRVKCFDNYSEEWAHFVYKNRRNTSAQNIHDYDIVFGSIANDTVGYQVRRFTDGVISLQEFLEEISYMKGETYQYLFATPTAIQYLKLIEQIIIK